jgi:carboxypeptidase family protein/TonB-dependent receptor-like protein
MRNTLCGALIGLCICVLACASVWAQSTAQISGTVKDQSGAVLPGVEVTVTQTDTGVKRSTPTNETGSYVLANLPLGPYRLESSLPGFRTFVQTGIVLQVNANSVINAILEVGQVAETVEVQAQAALVETRDSGVGTVIDNQRVLEMPLNGRQVTELILLSGLATPATSTGSLNSVRNYPTATISVGGGIANGTTFLLDGAIHNDIHTNLNLPLPFPDALQEFKVETSGLAAQYGLHSAGVVNAVTKSGTNEFHGDAFEFVRNGVFNARNFFATQRDSLKRNQLGGVVGGPLKKDKLLFFAGYQRTFERSNPIQTIQYVPTTAMLAGDFTTVTSPLCNNGRQITLAAPQGFVNNQISPSRFNSSALKILSRMIPSTDACGKVTIAKLANKDDHQFVGRMDYTKSIKQSLFGRLLIANLITPSTFDGKNIMTVSQAANKSRVYTLALGDTYLLGSGTVNSFRIGVTRTNISAVVDNMGHWTDYGVNIPFALAPLINISVSGNGTSFGGGGSALISVTNTGPNYSFADDLSWVHGVHQFGFGASYMHSENTFHAGTNTTGAFTFSGQTTGLGYADFLLGLAATFTQGDLSSYYNRQHYIAAYAQDAWKITPRLTMNYGIRWEPYHAFSSKYGWFEHFDPLLFSQNIHSSRFVNAPAGMIFPGDPQYQCGNSIHCRRLVEFLPRLGLAWDPKGDGKTSVRASYGMFLDRQEVIALTGYGQAAPFGNRIDRTNVNLSDPWAGYPGGSPLPIPLVKDMIFPSFSQYITNPYHLKPTAVQQWNLSLQTQVGSSWMVQVSYVGTGVSHLQTGDEANPVQYLGLGPCTIAGVTYATCSTTANINQRRSLFLQNPDQGKYLQQLARLDDGGTGNYNALFLSAQKRLSHGVSLLSNYTFSHCISDFWNPFVGNSGFNIMGWSPRGRKNERSNCDTSDVRQVVNLSAVFQTPVFSNRVFHLMASNWQLAPILNIASGRFFTVTTGLDNALSGLASQRPNQVLAHPYQANKSVNGWINPAAYANPAPGTYGNVARDTLRGPGLFTLNLGLSRTFSVGEKKTLQLRAEAFNIVNHANFGNPVSSLNSGSFGKIQTAGDPRIMQFALKYVF